MNHFVTFRIFCAEISFAITETEWKKSVMINNSVNSFEFKVENLPLNYVFIRFMLLCSNHLQYLNGTDLDRVYRKVIHDRQKRVSQPEVVAVEKKDTATLTDRPKLKKKPIRQPSTPAKSNETISMPKTMVKTKTAMKKVNKLKRKQINPSPTQECLLERLSFHVNGIISMLDEVM